MLYTSHTEVYSMEYEIIELKEKTVTGVTARTNNNDPAMTAVIGGLWEKFFSPSVCQAITGRKNAFTLGIYTDYAGTEKDDYTVIVGCEVDADTPVSAPLELRKLPAGKYARFTVRGDVHTAVAEFWQQLWAMKLPRAFTCDFEEYRNNDMEHAEIFIYISLK
jgi:predicted transcriptional regulator YdeE